MLTTVYKYGILADTAIVSLKNMINNSPISFRLSDDELELLAKQQDDGESVSLTAKRLLLIALGVAPKKSDIYNDIQLLKSQIETLSKELHQLRDKINNP